MLEAAFMAPTTYPALTRWEIESIAGRVRSGEGLSRYEIARLEQQSPVIDGEFLVTCHRGDVAVKRYIGIDLGEL